MKYTDMDCELSWTGESGKEAIWEIPKNDTESEDYEDVLTSFEDIVSPATQSEIWLPY